MAITASADEAEESDTASKLTKSLTFMIQALLTRHEAYVAEAEKERRRMMETIERLEFQNTELEDANRRTVQQNRDLLDQLEALNNAAKDSEGKTQALTEDIHSIESELRRMNYLASQTSTLQSQLSQLEEDLSKAHSTVGATREESKLATLRWQQSEKTIEFLQTQMEKIEADAQQERELHADVLSRIERRKAVENQLRTDRPWKTKEQENGVVSHFVTDILQDNANLQLGITELREMLNRSNDEVERLREHVVYSPTSDMPEEYSQTPTLGTELGSTKEIHVHHHYHPPPRASENRASRSISTRRKSKRKGSGSTSHTPRSSISLAGPPILPQNSILSHTSATIPSRGSKRWSTQSATTGFTSSSSLPSSPYADSIFDRMYNDTATDLSRPSSPDSLILSPRTGNGFDVYEISKQEPPVQETSDTQESFHRSNSEGLRSANMSVNRSGKAVARDSILLDHDAFASTSIILEENEDLEASIHTAKLQRPASPVAPIFNKAHIIRPTIRRATSHESLISIHGMDIHTLNSRPSQLLLGKYVSSTIPSASIATGVSGESAFGTQASSTRRPQNQTTRTSSQALLSGIAAQHSNTLNRKSSRPSLPGRVGGWVWSRWSNTSAPSSQHENESVSSANSSVRNVEGRAQPVDQLRSPVAATPSGTLAACGPSSTPITVPAAGSPARNLTVSPRKVFQMRSPGINQPGPIFGFLPDRKLDPIPVMKSFNVDALRDVLEEGGL